MSNGTSVRTGRAEEPAGEAPDGEAAGGEAAGGEGVRRRPPALLAPALLGELGAVLVLIGTLPLRSPYVVKIAGAWSLGSLAPLGTRYPGLAILGWSAMLGLVAVLGGVALIGVAFASLARAVGRGVTLRPVAAAALVAGWTLPFVLVAPLFSRDVYTYAAQGQMLALHLDPYRHGPAVLGAQEAFARLADPIWRRSVSPYGPLFLLLDEGLVLLTGHAALATVEGLRLLSLAGVLLAAAAAASIARSLGRGPVLAALLVAANPLVLTSLVAGAHDDALMIGLCSCGVALALRRGPVPIVAAVALVALAATVKAPAAVALPFIGWSRGGAGAPPRRRLASAVLTTAAGGGLVEAVTAGSGLGWGWVHGLANAGIVRLWASPTTAVGMVLGTLARSVGLVHGRHGWLAVIGACRVVGIVLAAAIVLLLLLRTRPAAAGEGAGRGDAGGDGAGRGDAGARVGAGAGVSFVRNTGLALSSLALLGTAVWPWYLCWGIALLAPVVTPRGRSALVAGSVAASYLGVPVGSVLIGTLERAGGWAAAAMAGVLLVAALAIVATALAARGGKGGGGRPWRARPVLAGTAAGRLRPRALR